MSIFVKTEVMILIDSLYINNSGGLRLLDYLVRRLNEKAIPFFLLADIRCLGKFDYCKHVRYVKASLYKRKLFYKENGSMFSSVLCFGNIPAPVQLEVPVYTYFHNINLLTLSEASSIKELLVMWLKRLVFRYYKKNTNYWLVQTINTQKELCRHLDESEKKVILMPFYELPEDINLLKNDYHGEDYVFVSNYTGAKGHEELLDAWRLLHEHGIDKTLHLTVPRECSEFISKIDKVKAEGVNVENHGFIPFDKVLDLYRKSKAIVYPSHNESLGLGLVEAIEAGCDVLASNLPFVFSVCTPTLVFDPYTPESIANAIMKYEKGEGKRPQLLIRNQLDELLHLLVRNN